MIRVFVSGCYDILHAGHVQFFREARALGDHLTVCFASNDVLWLHKQRRSSLPDEHKHALLAALDGVDDVVIGAGKDEGIDFREHFLRLKPDILAVTEDDRSASSKRAFVCGTAESARHSRSKPAGNFSAVGWHCTGPVVLMTRPSSWTASATMM